MDGLLRDAAQFTQLELLVTQQRYDESLKLLNEAIAKNPQDRDAYLCRLLVARIVVLRRQLAELPSLRSSKRKVLSFCSALVQPRHIGWDALYRNAIQWRPRRAMLWMGGIKDCIVLQMQRLRAIRTIQKQQARASTAQRIRLSSEPRGLSQRLRHGPLPLTAVSAVSLLAVVTVTVGLLRSGDMSNQQVRANVVAVSSVTKPPVAPAASLLPAQPSVSAAAPAGNAPKAEDQGSSALRESAETAALKTLPPAVKAPVKELKKAAKAPRHPEPVAKTAPLAVRQESQEVAENKKLIGGAATRISTHFYRARRPIAVRQAAKYAAPTVETLAEGAVVAVLDVKNSWARVTLNGNAPGFVRIEYLAPVEIP
ncbi:MAG: hypothetical protein FJ145_16120 [Deltaproteobacteria bacterium]|nr:hypothetical protein [Deltaproteobacteria bacterium]